MLKTILAVKNKFWSFSRARHLTFLWQLLLAGLMLGMAVFFIRSEHVELSEITEQFQTVYPIYLLFGILLTALYIVLQGEMYVQSFKTVYWKLKLRHGILLFLKRNLVSVFLPAGGFSSLAFFSKNLEKRGATPSQINLASSIYALCGILTVVVIALPVMGWALFKNQLQTVASWGFIFLVVLSAFLVWMLISILHRGWAFRFIIRCVPSWKVILQEMANQNILRKHFYKTLFISLIIEFVGVAHLYVSILAFGFEPSLPAALIGYVVMVILLIASPFLRGLGAIELSVAFTLGQYGIPLAGAASITLLFRFFEFWIPLFTGIGSFFTKKDNLVLRLFPALLIFALGITNIVSALTPAIPNRLRLVEDILPNGVIRDTNGLVLVGGLMLLLISIFLFRGSRRAFYLALFLTGFSIVGNLIKGGDVEESILALAAFACLLYTRSSYKLRPHPYFTRLSIQVVVLGILAILCYGALGFYFLDKKHFGSTFEWDSAISTVLRLSFLWDDQGITPLTRLGHYFLYSFYFAGAGFVLFSLYGLLKPYFAKPYNTSEDKKLALELIEKWGKSQLDYFKIYDDKFFFFSSDRQAFLSFKVNNHFAIVLEEPVCAGPEALRSIVKEFDKHCKKNGFVAIYYRVPAWSLFIFKSLKKKSLPIGEEALVDLTGFTLEGGKMKTTRNAVNRLTAEGFVFKVYDAPIKDGVLQKIEWVSTQWLASMKEKEVSFTQGIFNKTILKNNTLLTIEDKEEKIYAFLNLIPDYAPGEATYDLIRKVPDAPNGVLDMLLAKTFFYLKEQLYQKVNMGLAPLSGMESGNLTERTIRYAYENIRSFGHFKGLRKYKEKFFPVWEKKFLVYDHNYHLFQIPSALRKVSEVNQKRLIKDKIDSATAGILSLKR